MKNNSFSNFYLPISVFWILSLSFIGIVFSYWFSFSLLVPVAFGVALLTAIFYLQNPLLLLAALIIVRMSLDYSSQYFSLTFYDITLTLSQLLGLGIAILGILTLYLKKKTVLSYPFLIPFCLVLLWGTGTLFSSYSPSATFAEILRVFGLLSIGAMTYVFVENKKDYSLLLWAILLSSIIPLTVSLYQFLFGIGFVDSDVAIPRIFGTFSHPNILSLYLFALLAAATLFYFKEESPSQKTIRWSLIFMSIFSVLLLLTFARVAWVSAFVFFAVIIFFRHRLALLPILLFPIVLYFFSATFADRVNESLSPHPDSSIIWRQNLWHDTLLSTQQDGKIVTGYGMGTFPLVSEVLRGENVGSHDPHNDLVRFLVEGGYIGLIIYTLYVSSILIILYVKAQHTIKPWLHRSLLTVTLFWACLLLASLSDNIFKNTPVEWIFFILSGALLKLSFLQKSPKSKKLVEG